MIVVAVVTAAAGWAADRPDITAREAVSAAGDALARADLPAQVDPRPIPETYRSRSQSEVQVWRVRATLDQGRIELYLARAGAQPVAIDDRSADGTAYLLSDRQYSAVARSMEDPALSRAMQRRVGLTVGAVLVAAVALGLVLLSEPGRRR
jgi:hypothetical protein